MKLKKSMKKILAVLLSAGMLMATGMTAAAVDGDAGTGWTHSKSKTAENLDENFESQITLSLPSAEEQLVTDVVFVLDKSTSANVESQITGMLNNLKNQSKGTGARINVGVVIFNKKANRVLKLTELNDENWGMITAAITQEISSGTNLHAGLLAGKEMLDSDTSVDADRKYLITVSDGITYLFNETPTVTGVYWLNDGSPYLSSDTEGWKLEYGNDEAPTDWDSWLSDVGSSIAAGGQIDVNYETALSYVKPERKTAEELKELGYKEVERADEQGKQGTYYSCIDKALYLSYQTYQAAKNEGYHCYVATAETSSAGRFKWGPSFMNFLAGGETCDFSEIQNDIYYMLDAGSYVEDYMGYEEDGYDFDFVNDASKLSLKVGDEVLEAVAIDENTYGFGAKENEYAYTLEYVRGNGRDEEHFIWNIYVPVSNFAPVQLTYTVKLTNPQTEPGTYGQYDADGSEGYDGLYTNNSAVLYPVDTDSQSGTSEAFSKPTVSYTVEKKAEEPEQPETPEDTPKEESGQQTKPAPKTGDETSVAMWVILMAAAVVFLVAAGAVKLKSRRRG